MDVDVDADVYTDSTNTNNHTSTTSPLATSSSSSPNVAQSISLIPDSHEIQPDILDNDTIQRLKLLRCEKKRKHLLEEHKDHGEGYLQERKVFLNSDDEYNDMNIDIEEKGAELTTIDPIDSDDEFIQYSPINNDTNTMKFIGSRYMNCESVPVIIIKESDDSSNNNMDVYTDASNTNNHTEVSGNDCYIDEVETSLSPLGSAAPLIAAVTKSDEIEDSKKIQPNPPIGVPLIDTERTHLVTPSGELDMDPSAPLEAIDREGEELRLLKRREKYLKVIALSSTCSVTLTEIVIYPLTETVLS
jgi:hypothetical protein